MNEQKLTLVLVKLSPRATLHFVIPAYINLRLHNHCEWFASPAQFRLATNSEFLFDPDYVSSDISYVHPDIKKPFMNKAAQCYSRSLTVCPQMLALFTKNSIIKKNVLIKYTETSNFSS